MDQVKPKKYLWILSVLLPLVGLSGISLYEMTSVAWCLLLPIAFIYIGIPLLDWLFSTDNSNPDAAQLIQLEQSKFYDWILFLMLPVHFFVFYTIIDYTVSQELTFWMHLTLLLTLGVFGGLAINLGHELGHKKDRWSKNLAKLALATGAYGHFNVEHNAGHHRDVATPEDSASAKLGESIYRFALREFPGGLKRAWRIETTRLTRHGLKWYSKDNQILHSYILTIIIYGLLTAMLGWPALLLMLAHAPLVWWQLTSANYIEHYGLLRQKNKHGKYERCEPRHSWNSNHLISNLVLFHLQRHSDHHANPSRHYQSLRHFAEAPQLPTGYMGMFVLAYFPPLWYKVMDKRLLSMYQNDMRLINH
ncbi:alkane 1-monooxygenase [Marinicella litoralis]|uniref:Alkane 1-monooxygenase n=1 Tax=Marinicella litoralis TaxID=644220 RepID=A0A4R6XWZ6_9GAMM|nr:alkane 1-monooxygenase [Marinicella litoralis]TDR22697.1 alkane 1-monooxygenase [Marinicella litoralis]